MPPAAVGAGGGGRGRPGGGREGRHVVPPREPLPRAEGARRNLELPRRLLAGPGRRLRAALVPAAAPAGSAGLGGRAALLGQRLLRGSFPRSRELFRFPSAQMLASHRGCTERPARRRWGSVPRAAAAVRRCSELRSCLPQAVSCSFLSDRVQLSRLRCNFDLLREPRLPLLQ